MCKRKTNQIAFLFTIICCFLSVYTAQADAKKVFNDTPDASSPRMKANPGGGGGGGGVTIQLRTEENSR